VVAVGVTVQLEELFGKKHVPTYGADYEVTTQPDPHVVQQPAPSPPAAEDDEAKHKPAKEPEQPAALAARPAVEEKRYFESTDDVDTMPELDPTPTPAPATRPRTTNKKVPAKKSRLRQNQTQTQSAKPQPASAF